MDVLAKEVHRRAVKKFPRRIVKAYGADGVWAMDLVDMTADWVEENDGYRYILVVIDVFTRYAWLVPLRDKSGATLEAVLRELFKQAVPQQVWADKGSEFYNKDVKKLFKKHQVELYSTYSESKAAIAESFNRNMKAKTWRLFTEHQDRNWIDRLENLVHEYNHTRHSTIKMTPAEARTGRHDDELLRLQDEREERVVQRVSKKKAQLKAGDRVRISRVKGTFEKGAHPNWSYEIYTVDEVRHTMPVTYRIKDHKGEAIEGTFYEQELQKTAQGETYLVEEVIKTRKVKGKTQYFVKWLGYPASDNSWVDEKDVGDVKKLMKKKN